MFIRTKIPLLSVVSLGRSVVVDWIGVEICNHHHPYQPRAHKWSLLSVGPFLDCFISNKYHENRWIHHFAQVPDVGLSVLLNQNSLTFLAFFVSWGSFPFFISRFHRRRRSPSLVGTQYLHPTTFPDMGHFRYVLVSVICFVLLESLRYWLRINSCRSWGTENQVLLLFHGVSIKLFGMLLPSFQHIESLQRVKKVFRCERKMAIASI